MGVKLLLLYLKKITNKKIVQSFPISQIKGHKIALDLAILTYEAKSGCINNEIKGLKDPIYDTPDYEKCRVYSAKRVLDKIYIIFEGGCIPIPVFDGIPPDLKKGTKDIRLGKSMTKKHKLEELRRIGDNLLNARPVNEDDVQFIKYCTTKHFRKKHGEVDSIDKLRLLIKSILRQFVVVNSEDYLLLAKLFSALGIPHIFAVSEAEQTCAIMCARKDVTAIYTTDSDCLVYGCPIMINEIKHSPGISVKIPATLTCYTFKNVLEATELNHAQFIDFCILCGTDFNNNVPGYGAVKHHDFIKRYKSIPNIIKAREQAKNKRLEELDKIEKLLLDYEIDAERYKSVIKIFTDRVSYDKNRLILDIKDNQIDIALTELNNLFSSEYVQMFNNISTRIITLAYDICHNKTQNK